MRHCLFRLSISNPVDTSFIGSIIWFCLLGLVVRYFQAVIGLEKLYHYIQILEKHLSANYGDSIYTREGNFYLTNYPVILYWAWLLYTVAFPLLLMVIVITKIIWEGLYAMDLQNFPMSLLFNILFSASILISTFLYLIVFHSKK